MIADALRMEIEERRLQKRFLCVHEAVSDPAPFQYFLPLGTAAAAPISYYCVAGGSLGWSLPASLGIKLERRGRQDIETHLVVAAVGDGSALFYRKSGGPQRIATWLSFTSSRISMNTTRCSSACNGASPCTARHLAMVGTRKHGPRVSPHSANSALDFAALAKALAVRRGHCAATRRCPLLAAVRRELDYVLQMG